MPSQRPSAKCLVKLPNCQLSQLTRCPRTIGTPMPSADFPSASCLRRHRPTNRPTKIPAHHSAWLRPLLRRLCRHCHCHLPYKSLSGAARRPPLCFCPIAQSPSPVRLGAQLIGATQPAHWLLSRCATQVAAPFFKPSADPCQSIAIAVAQRL